MHQWLDIYGLPGQAFDLVKPHYYVYAPSQVYLPGPTVCISTHYGTVQTLLCAVLRYPALRTKLGITTRTDCLQCNSTTKQYNHFYVFYSSTHNHLFSLFTQINHWEPLQEIALLLICSNTYKWTVSVLLVKFVHIKKHSPHHKE